MTSSRRARAGRRAVPSWLVLVASVVVACSGGGDPVSAAAAELQRRLADAARSERFVIAYRAAGTQVLDCFLPNRQFDVAVDRDAGVLEVTRSGEPTQRLAKVVDGAVYLHRSLFEAGTLPSPWLRVPATPERRTRAVLKRVIGADLAGHLFAGGLPPGGEETAAASLDVARDVRGLGREKIGGRYLDGYRIVVDEERFASEATVPGTDGSSEPAPPGQTPIVDVWLDDRGRVARLVIRREVSGATDPDAVAGGWIADYRTLDSALAAQPPADVTDVGAIDPMTLRSASSGSSELGLGSGSGEVFERAP